MTLTENNQGTPETGQGANNSIETAAALGNHLARLMVASKSSKKAPTNAEIAKCLRAFQEHRQPRAKAAMEETSENVRVLSYSNPVAKFIMTYIGPYLYDIQPNQNSARYIGSERVESLPLPEKSLKVTMPFNPTQGLTKEESRTRRALEALPILALGLSSCFPPANKDAAAASPLLQVFLSPVYAIWMLEGCRSINYLKPISW